MARCYAAWWQGQPGGVLRHAAGDRPARTTGGSARIVTLPDYQGVGIGMRVAEAVCDLHRDRGMPDQRHGQPSGAGRPLPPLAAVADRAGAQDRLGQHAAVHSPTIAARRAGRVVSFEYLGKRTVSEARREADPGGRALDDVKKARDLRHPGRGLQPHDRRAATSAAIRDTIRRRTASDADFAPAHRAGRVASTRCCTCRYINKAGQGRRYWRAAAWALERALSRPLRPAPSRARSRSTKCRTC